MLLEAVRGGQKACGIGSCKKLVRMAWCLAEGFRSMACQFLRGQQAMTVMQDSKDEKLLIRFRACDSNLDARVGALENTGPVAGPIRCICRWHQGCNAGNFGTTFNTISLPALL